MANVITLTGAAHCGKTTIVNFFLKSKDNKSFKPERFKKHTTREARENDEDVISVKSIPKECNIVYEHYGTRYGLNLNDLYEKLEKGISPIVVLNDIRAIEDVKRALGSFVLSLFIYRKPTSLENFIQEESERTPNNTQDSIIKVAKTRYQKSHDIFRIYIENISLFDHVIINSNTIDYTKLQVDHIINKISCITKNLLI